MQTARARLVNDKKIYSAEEREAGIWELTHLGRISAGDLLNERIIDNDVIYKGLSQEELEKRLTKKKIIGDIGKDIVLQIEKQYFIENSAWELSEKAKRVSIEDCRLDYDILSYNLDGSKKFIEVKSSEKINNEFYLTNNERNQLNMYQDKYSIYIVQGINISNKTHENIIRINNPKREFKSENYSM